MHARMTLDGDGLKTVVPEGADAAAQRAATLRLFPPAQYWRYDRRPPTPLAMWLPEDYTARNPFYYFHGSPEEEQRLLYARMLGRLASSGLPTLVFGPDRGWLSLAPTNGKLWRAVTEQPLGAAALRPKGHQSPLGNLAVAEQVACALEGRSRCPVDALRVDEAAPDTASAAPASGPLALSFGRAGPADFARQERVGGAIETFEGSPSGPLVALASAPQSWLDVALLPVEATPPLGTPLRARWRRGGRDEEAVIGSIVARSPDLAVARLAWHLLYTRRQGFRLEAPVPTGVVSGVWLGERRLLAPCGPAGLLCPEPAVYYKAYLRDARTARDGERGAIELGRGGRTRRVGSWTRLIQTVALELAGPAGSPLEAACGPSRCRR
jgi:hypothetical protein